MPTEWLLGISLPFLNAGVLLRISQRVQQGYGYPGGDEEMEVLSLSLVPPQLSSQEGSWMAWSATPPLGNITSRLSKVAVVQISIFSVV